MESQEILIYLSRKVIEDLRSHKDFDDELSRALNRQPYVEYLRSEIKDPDVSMLMEMVRNTDKAGLYGLAITLLPGGQRTEEIKSFLSEQWNRPGLSFEFKNNLMWRLLDYEDLDVSIHKEIYDFVKNNRDQWIRQQINWIGGRDLILEFVKSRLRNPDFPETKNWVYLYECPEASDKAGARQLIESYRNSKASIVSEVVEDLLENSDDRYL